MKKTQKNKKPLNMPDFEKMAEKNKMTNAKMKPVVMKVGFEMMAFTPMPLETDPKKLKKQWMEDEERRLKSRYKHMKLPQRKCPKCSPRVKSAA